jgi:HlyD family secretion protein
MKPGSNSESDIVHILGINQSPTRGKHLRRWLVVSLVTVAVVTTVMIRKGVGTSCSVQYKTQEVIRGNLTVIVTATGTLQPTNQVDVGSELSGIIKCVKVDYNDKVKVN